MQQPVDANVDMYIPPTADSQVSAIDVFTHILREASASLLVQLRWAHARASNRRTSNKYGSHAFSL